MMEIRVPVGAGELSASVHGSGETVLLLGHGAGGTRKTPFLVRLAEAVAASGRAVVLFNFPYADAGRRAPDRPPALEAAVRAACAHARGALGARRLVLGGKSMGGRMASQVVAQGEPADGLLLLGYPLHPAGRSEKLRDAHLPSLRCPLLFVQGTRDALARFDLMEPLARRLGATLHAVEGGDHSFAVPKRAGRTEGQVESEIAGAIVAWLGAHRL
ncbi:MAG TPA: alpha/beta fold hydrolase [Vicinamibacteria bacterium]|nr:alpha/beta fold hydrolase [Vicinamibacteria bacterium]